MSIPWTQKVELFSQHSICRENYFYAALRYALIVRRSPLEYRDDKETFDYAEMLAEPIQRFADVLEKAQIQAKEINQ